MTRRTRKFKTTVEYNGKSYVLEGEQHQRHSVAMGQLEIQSINGKRARQILPGMPEIHYTFTESHPFFMPPKATKAVFTQKMDGTAVLFSGIDLLDGSVAVFARTRGALPVKDTKWRPLGSLLGEAVSEDVLKGIERACLTQKATLVFELYGNKNRHTVKYETPVMLELHTVIKGKGTVQPWTLLKQIAKANGIPTVAELDSIPKELLSESGLKVAGDLLSREQESANNAEAGEYLYEGSVLNIETPTVGYQWKFKPPSMEEFHRVARTSICPVTVAHTLWKMVDDEKYLSLDNLVDAMASDYGYNTVHSQFAMIEHEYWAWMAKEEQYFALMV